MSLKDNILAKANNRAKLVAVEMAGETLYVPVLTLRDAEQLKDFTEEEDSFAKLFLYVARDENGQRIFSDSDLPAVKELSLAEVKKVVEKFNEINALGDASKN